MARQAEYLESDRFAHLVENLRFFQRWHDRNGGVTEVRIHYHGGRVYAGWYDDSEAMAKEIAPHVGKANIYVTLHSVNPVLLKRTDVNGVQAYNKLVCVTKPDKDGPCVPALTTNDDTVACDIFVIDVDSVRAEGHKRDCATDEEKAAALEVAERIRNYLMEAGVTAIPGDSGNGAGLLVPLPTGTDPEEGRRQAKALAEHLAEKFDTDAAHVDLGVYNRGRIWRCYGTMNVKGKNTSERPHRCASADFSNVPNEQNVFARLTSVIEPYLEKERDESDGDGADDDMLPMAPEDAKAIVTKCLELLSPKRCEEYEDWLDVGMIIHRMGLSVDIWDEWSRKNKAKYEPGICEKKWKTFDADRDGKKVGTGTLLRWASEDSGKSVKEILKEAGVSAKKIKEGWSDYDQLAKRFIKETYGDGSKKRLIVWNGGFFVYEAGRYVEVAEQQLQATITRWLSRLNNKLRKGYGFSLNTSVSFVKNIFHSVVAQTIVGQHVTLNSWLDGKDWSTVISLKNGLLFLDERGADGRPTLRKHDSGYFTVVRLPYPYDPKATCKTWLQFLADTLGSDAEYIRLLQQWAGYLLMPTLKYRKFLLGLGEGGTGKGTLVGVLCAMPGEENVSGVGLHQFGQRFGLTPTLGKAFNWIDETVHYVDPNAEETVKAFVAGTPMTFDRKNRDAVLATPTAKVIITSNSEPRWNDKSMGTWDRVLLVPFENRVEETDRIPDLGDKLKAELPGILNWAIEGMDDLERTTGFVRPRRNEELLAQYRRDCDPARTFLEDGYAFAPNAAVGLPKDAVYKAYREFCDRTGCKPLNGVNFGRTVFRVFPEVEASRPRKDGVRVPTYVGLIATTIDEVPWPGGGL